MILSKQFLKYTLVLLLTVIGLFLFMVSTKPKIESNDKEQQVISNVKIDPEVLKTIEESENGKARVIVYMSEQADLKDINAKGLGNLEIDDPQIWNERRQVVYRTLTHLAVETQVIALNHLKERKNLAPLTKSFWIFNGFMTIADKDIILELSSLPEVGHISLDKVIQLSPDEVTLAQEGWDENHPGGPSWGITKIQANQVWTQLKDTGVGVVIGSIDTGAQWDHPALKNKYRGWDGKTANHVYSWYDAVNHQIYPYDDQGHGTHALGIVVGDDGAGNQIGVAPGAKWIAVKALNSNGSGLVSDLFEAMQWMLAPGGDPSKAPHVVNNSWGAAICENAFVTAVQSWRAAGIIPVFAGGNSGEKGNGSLGSPACYPSAIAVGATDFEDQIALFSSRGPSALGVIKPDFSAPGVNIRSSLNNNGYGFKNGTSMAAPYVTGVIALMLSANPQLSIDEIEKALQQTAIDFGPPGQDNNYGWGRVNALGAVGLVRRRATIDRGSYDDSYPEIVYIGDWTYIDECELCFQDSLHLSEEIYASVRFTFYGDEFSLINTYGPSFGKMQVIIDDSYKEFLDLYAPYVQWKKQWTSQPLASGKHTITIINDSGKAINLDAVILN